MFCIKVFASVNWFKPNDCRTCPKRYKVFYLGNKYCIMKAVPVRSKILTEMLLSYTLLDSW